MAQIAPGLAIGTEFAGYRIESLLGQGGMGAVYLATHIRLGRRAALKVLLPEYAGDESFRDRFTRESQLAASLEHPNIVPVYDADERDGVFYLAIRYVEGEDLKTWLRRAGALAPEETLTVIEQTALALDAAHAAGLVHRDVKPANILIGKPGMRVYLTDFGIAKRAAAPGLTRTGFFIGTVDYSAPEQMEGKHVDARADVYSLGCVLFECLTGRVPYVGDSEVAVIQAHLLEPPPAPTSLRPDLPQALDAVIATAMAKSREARYPTSSRLAQATREALQGRAVVEPTVDNRETVPAGVVTARAALPPSVATGEVGETIPANALALPPATRPAERTPERTAPRRGRLRGKPLVIAGILVLCGAAATAATLILARGGEKAAQTVAQGSPVAPSERPGLAVVGGSPYLTHPSGQILRLNPSSLAVERTLPDAAHPRAVVGADGKVLAADDRALTTLRASDLSPVAAVDFGPSPLLAAGASGSPVAAAHGRGAGEGRVCTVRQAALSACADLDFPPSGLGVGPGGRVFVSDAKGGTVRPFTLRGGALVAGKPLTVQGEPRGNLFEFRGSLYAAVADGVAVVDLRQGGLSKTISLGSTPSSIWIVPSTGRLFVALPSSGEVAVVDVTSPEAAPRRIQVGNRPAALASALPFRAGDAVYLANVGDATAARLDPLTGEVLRSQPVEALRAKPLAPLVVTSVTPGKAGRTVIVTIRLTGGRLQASGLVPRDTAIGDGRASVELWQGGISTKVAKKQVDGLSIRIRPAPGRLVVAATAKGGAFSSFAARRGSDGRSVQSPRRAAASGF